MLVSMRSKLLVSTCPEGLVGFYTSGKTCVGFNMSGKTCVVSICSERRVLVSICPERLVLVSICPKLQQGLQSGAPLGGSGEALISNMDLLVSFRKSTLP